MSILGVRRVLKDNTIVKELDLEWLELILEAKRMGMTIEEIRDYLFSINGNGELPK
jgi:hypothetical protein